MSKLEKVEGKKANCPICDDSMVCVNKPYNGKDKLQWQNPNGTAHYNFDFKTNTTSCNRTSSEKTESTSSKETVTSPAKSSSLMEFILNYDFTELKEPEQEAVEKKAKKLFEQKLIVTKVAMETFASAGFDNVASV
ncbi:MAG: hypothetical protein KGI05_08230, partial [Thaumarchaeota archaeon]|nr:hypothetical protein [Nitrososphaerota archaeon]